MLDKEFKYYKDHQTELVSKYDGKYIVIIDSKVVGVYETHIEAYTTSKNKYEVGTFLIQYCSDGEPNYTQSFHSRVHFSQ